MRSRRRIAFDFLFLLIGVGKWVVALYLGVNLYFVFPPLFWILVFIFLGDKVIRDIYRVLKAIIKDTTIDNLNSEGEQSYLKGMSEKSYSDLKAFFFAVVIGISFSVICVLGVFHNYNLWQQDGVNRLGNIAFLSFFGSLPLLLAVQLLIKKY